MMEGQERRVKEKKGRKENSQEGKEEGTSSNAFLDSFGCEGEDILCVCV